MFKRVTINVIRDWVAENWDIHGTMSMVKKCRKNRGEEVVE